MGDKNAKSVARISNGLRIDQESVKAVIGPSLLSLKNKTLPVITVIETVKPLIVVAAALPIVELVAHFQLVLFVKVIEDSRSVYFSSLGTFEKGHVLPVL